MRIGLLILTAVLLGGVFAAAAITGRWPPVPGRLPGDIRIEGTGGTFFFPLTTCVVISLLLTLLLNLWLSWPRGGR